MQKPQQTQQLQQIQMQAQPQLIAGIRSTIRTKSPRGGITGTPTLIATRMPVPRGGIRGGLTQVVTGQTLKTPRPRSSTTASGSPRRGGARGRGGANAGAGRGTMTAASMQQGPQQLMQTTASQGKITIASINQQGQQVKQVFRTQIIDPPGITHQQLQLLSGTRQVGQGQQIIHAPSVTRFRSPPAGVTQAQQSPSAVASGSNFELDLEESIQAVVVKKGNEQQKPATAVATTSAAVVPNQMNTTTLTTYYTKDNNDDDTRIVRTQNGACMSLAEYKKRQQNPTAVLPAKTATMAIRPTLQATTGASKIQLPSAALSSISTVPVARVAPQKVTTVTQQQPQLEPPSQAPASSVHRTSHNNYEIQTQHVLQNRSGQQMAEKDRNSAKMLVILASGEQRLITFTLPRESCTVQDLLEQVGVPFDSSTTIRCVENPGANIDFVVTVGFSVQESASELISRAEQSLQMSKQQESGGNNIAPAAPTAAAATSSNAPSSVANALPIGEVGSSNVSASYGSLANAAAAAASDEAARIATTAASGSRNAASAAAAAAAAAASAQNKSVDEVPQKIIQGYYAICQSCGFSGYDHAKCERYCLLCFIMYRNIIQTYVQRMYLCQKVLSVTIYLHLQQMPHKK